MTSSPDLIALENQALAVGLALPRIIAAFLVMPLMTPETVPATVRNSFFVSLAVIAYPVAERVVPMAAAGDVLWPLVVIKELFVGLLLGFLFGGVFWAVGAAGELIDSQIGANLSGIMDPIQGHQTTLSGDLLSQLAAWLFMASGAFMVFLDLLMSSYAIWPIAERLPSLQRGSQLLFIDGFGYVMSTALLFASPAIAVLAIIDLSMGLVNRFAQQLNVFQMSMAIKALAAQFMLLLSLGVIVEIVIRKLYENEQLLEILKNVLK